MNKRHLKLIKAGVIFILLLAIVSAITWWYLHETVKKEIFKISSEFGKGLYVKLSERTAETLKNRFIFYIGNISNKIKNRSSFYDIFLIGDNEREEIASEILKRIEVFKMRLGNASEIKSQKAEKILKDIVSTVKSNKILYKEIESNGYLRKRFSGIIPFNKKATDKTKKNEGNKIIERETKVIPDSVSAKGGKDGDSNSSGKKDFPARKLPSEETGNKSVPDTSGNGKDDNTVISLEKLPEFIGKRVVVIYKLDRVQEGILQAVGKNFIDLIVNFEGGNMRLRIYLSLIRRVEKVSGKWNLETFEFPVGKG